MLNLPEPFLVALIGAAGGLLLGLAARLGRFCTMGAIEDYLYSNSSVRLRMWGMAIGVAVVSSFLMLELGYLTLSQTYYFSIAWMPVASVLGGLVFGYGMALAGNCGFGSMARLGGGDLRAFVIVLVMGVSAYAVLSGPFAYIRDAVFPQVPPTGEIPQGIAHLVAHFTGLNANWIGIVIGALIILAMLAGSEFRQDASSVIWASVVGLAVVSGWVGTQWVANTGFEDLPVVSHSFSAPLGEAILFTMTASGRSLSFAVGSVGGVWLGAFIGSLIKGHFRWEACEDPRELRRQIIGAALMGAGAVVALGCTVGQGITAFSLLAYSAPVTFVAIFAGAAFGLRQLISGFQSDI